MITHELTDIPVSVKRIIMVKDGHVYADGPKEELLSDSKISELFGESISVECTDGIYRMHLVGDVAE